MNLVTAALGAECRAEAARLAGSLRAHGWRARLWVLSDAQVEGAEVRLVSGRLPRGVDIKTGFARFLPDLPADSPVAWLDSDCLAIGPEPTWQRLAARSVAGVPWLTVAPGLRLSSRFQAALLASAEGSLWLRAMFLHFDCLATAREVCGLWGQNYLGGEDESSLALSLAQLGVSAASTGGKVDLPLPSLRHYFGLVSTLSLVRSAGE